MMLCVSASEQGAERRVRGAPNAINYDLVNRRSESATGRLVFDAFNPAAFQNSTLVVLVK